MIRLFILSLHIVSLTCAAQTIEIYEGQFPVQNFDYSQESLQIQELIAKTKSDNFIHDTSGSFRTCYYHVELLTIGTTDTVSYYLLEYEKYTGIECSLRYSSWLYVFDKNEKYLGYYWTKGTPGWHIVNENLACDNSEIMEDFKGGVPDQITLGDIIEFDFIME